MHKEAMMDDKKPLPCPFCGCEPEVFDFEDGRFLVDCMNAGCKVQPYTEIVYGRERAVADWNVRAGHV